jgi:hypothetical protein
MDFRRSRSGGTEGFLQDSRGSSSGTGLDREVSGSGGSGGAGTDGGVGGGESAVRCAQGAEDPLASATVCLQYSLFALENGDEIQRRRSTVRGVLQNAVGTTPHHI